MKKYPEKPSSALFPPSGIPLKFGFGPLSRIGKRNLAFNRQFSLSGPIHGQARQPVASMRYGAATAAWSGCGIIAAYNALLLLGNPQPLAEILAWGDLHASILFGAFGTSHRKMKRLFLRLGYNIVKVPRKALFDAQAKKADVCLFTFWNKKGRPWKGMHTVCVQYRENRLEVYNLYNNSVGMEPIDSFQKWEERGISPIALYCISKREPPAL